MKKLVFYILFALCVWACSTADRVSERSEEPDSAAENPQPPITGNETTQTYNYLALGDSYTIGESVCDTCNFPMQLKAAFEAETTYTLKTQIIARTGWRTESLISAVEAENPSQDQDLVTLLIGVNNQYQGGSLAVYKTEFKQLLETAVSLAKGDRDRVIVISIPDYAYTPFGQSTTNPEAISAEIDQFNSAAQQISEDANVTFLTITDLTRGGLDDPQLVASDGLHPSAKAYAKFIERLLPLAIGIIESN